MNNLEIITEEDKYILPVYNRFKIALDKGSGVYLFDADGKKYIDLASGIGVMAFGYGDREFKEGLFEQIDKLTHTSNLFYNSTTARAAKLFCKASGMDKVFFTNSGAEAIEGAIKAAKKYAHNSSNVGKTNIIAFESAFHGRTVGALSVTGTSKYREPFYPLMDGVKFATFNDLDSVKAVADDSVCAIIVEPIQGEGGINVATKEFLQGLRDLCDQKDYVLIFDEIQCGMGRCGELFAYQGYGVYPDIVTSAKGLGSGVPVGAFGLNEKVASNSLTPGDHGTTYGGNPLVCAAVQNVFEMIEQRNIIEHVKEVSEVFENKLNELCDKYDIIKGVKGVGLIRGLVIDEKVPVSDVIAESLEEGVIAISASGNIFRMLPPLVITEEEIEESVKIMDNVFKTIVNRL